MSQIADYFASITNKGYDGLTLAQVTLAINAGRRRLVMDRRWSFLEATDVTLTCTIGDPEVALSGIADLAHVDAVRLITPEGEERHLSPTRLQELRDEQVDFPESAEPMAWVRHNGDLILHPTPDRAYDIKVDYVTTLADLSGSDTDTFPDSMREVVAWSAIPDLAFRQREYQAATFAETQYQVLRNQAAAQDGLAQRQQSTQVKSGYWGTR